MIARLTGTFVLLVAAFQAGQPGKPADLESRVTDLLSQMTLEEKIDYIGGYQGFYVRPIDRLHLPAIKMADGPLGVRNYGRATAFPAGIAMAATWNADLVKAVGTEVGREARAKGVHIMLAPGLNIYRSPVCGRNFEYFGEDPFLSGQMAVAWVRAVQAQGVAATAKHFAGNNQEWERNLVSSDIDERTLREIYLPAFQAAVEEGKVEAVMTAYNLLNGTYCTHNTHLLKDILKRDWGFDGMVMSDWGATHDAIAAANGGLDLEMPSGAYMNRTNLLPAIKAGTVSMATIDDKVRRILRTIVRMGFLDRPQTLDAQPAQHSEAWRVALDAARESLVLLKNDRAVLPLDRAKIRRIAVIGPNAHPAFTGGSGSSRIDPLRSTSVLDGVTSLVGDRLDVAYAEGASRSAERYFADAVFFTSTPGDVREELPGLYAEYFANADLAGQPRARRFEPRIDLQWSDVPLANVRAPEYSVRWRGAYRASRDGAHQFVVRGGSGYRLFVDGAKVIDSWSQTPTPWRTAPVTLKAGQSAAIRMEIHTATGGGRLRLGVVEPNDALLTEAVARAKQADVAVVCVGFTPESEGEGYDRTFELPAGQPELIKAVAGANPNTIVVVMAGGNVATADWIGSVPALLHSWQPGQEGGRAIAEVLFGDVNPSGRLPATFEKRLEDNPTFNSYWDSDGDRRLSYAEGIFVGYRHYDRANVEPLFPFGFGLSYTTFTYSNLRLSAASMKTGGTLDVAVDVQNSGRVAGKETVQLYVRDVEASVPRPVKELKGFSKVALAPGQKTTVKFTLTDKALSFYDVKESRWRAEPGTFEVIIGSSSRHIRLQQSFERTN